jgi:DivIVA domain-containing protein
VAGERERNRGDSGDGRSDGAAQAQEDRASSRLLTQVPADIRDVSFATVVRGYDRREVDAYVERVNGVIAELEISRSPQSAIKHALDRVGQQTTGVLQRAREVAEELTETALAEADHVTRRAKVEADELVEEAQLRAHQLRGQSKDEADEIVARAAAAAAERLKHAEGQARAVHAEAEKRLRSMQADIRAATDARRRLLDELRKSAAELEAFAGGMIERTGDEPAAGSDEDAPTETLPTEAIATAAAANSPKPARERKPRRPPRANERRDGEVGRGDAAALARES